MPDQLRRVRSAPDLGPRYAAVGLERTGRVKAEKEGAPMLSEVWSAGGPPSWPACAVMLRMTLGEKLDSVWLNSLDYWSGRITRQPGIGGFITKRLPPIMVCVAALALTILARIVLPKDDGSFMLATIGPGIAAWIFIKGSKSRAQERHDARPERVPERVAVVERSLQAAAGETERAMAATKTALAQSHQLSADLQAQLESLTEAVAQTHAEGRRARLLADFSKHEVEAVTSLVANTFKPEVRHLDRMALVYAMSGWAAAVLVLVLDHHIPRW
ncbi:hypothetical protein C8250_042860 [Streptomyces sp. So13.3]|uniref:hypothetical protein n=1 Tax=Streptomyces sp. So13.3 TaxID=2136173 RepID=UPI0011061538|nr:hypothetical protein [Streptomyces sp. So13.3]QNA77613.1 hypothetical protein C8250_042860 [Streptomyces sp. So13.3]